MAKCLFSDENETALLNGLGSLDALVSLLAAAREEDFTTVLAEDLSCLLGLVAHEMRRAMPQARTPVPGSSKRV